MKAMLLLKDLADMILEADNDHVQLVFEDGDGDYQSNTYEVDWGDYPEPTIIVRVL